MNGKRLAAAIVAVVLAAGIAGTGSAGAAAQPGSCTAKPGSVTKTRDGLVRAGATQVTCSGAWTADEDVMYDPVKPLPAGKWSYGGGVLRQRHGERDDPQLHPLLPLRLR